MKPIFKLFKLNKKGKMSALGNLEEEIMEILWLAKEATVREVHDRLSEEREIAYTTVMTVMGRLSEKDYLRKEKDGKSHIYVISISKKEFERYLVRDVYSGLEKRLKSDFLNCFLDGISENDPEKLRELEALIQERKKAVSEYSK